MKCPTCNRPLKEGARFCSKCGTKIESNTEARPLAEMESGAPHERDEALIRDARVFFSRGATFERNGNFPVAVAAYDELISRCLGSTDKSVVEKVVQGMVNKGAALERMKLDDEALESYDDAIKKFSTTPGLARWIAKAYFRKSRLLAGMEDMAASNEALELLLKRYGANPSAAVAEWVAKGLLEKGRTLIEKDNKMDQGVAILDDLSATYSRFKEFQVAESVFKALSIKASVYTSVSKPEKATAAQNLIITRFLGRKEPEVIKGIYEIFRDKAESFCQSEKYDEALAQYDQFIEVYGNIADASATQHAASAMLLKSRVLATMKRPKESTAVLDEIISKFSRSMDRKTIECVNTAKDMKKKAGQ